MTGLPDGFVDLEVKTLGPGRHQVRIFVTEAAREHYSPGELNRYLAGELSLHPGRRAGETAGTWLRLREPYQRRGVATMTYRLLAVELAKLGEVLTNARPEIELSPGAAALWGPLIRMGCAVEAKDDEGRSYWRLENPDGNDDAAPGAA